MKPSSSLFLLRTPAGLIATWFGAGLMPWAPGSWGSAAALPFAWLILSLGDWWWLLAASLLLFVIGCWAAAQVEQQLGTHDSGLIVVDEVVGQWICLLPCGLDPVNFALGFILFRIMDIVKPWPVSWIDQKIGGGLGVMLDDVAAALYAVLAMGLLFEIQSFYK